MGDLVVYLHTELLHSFLTLVLYGCYHFSLKFFFINH